MPHSLNIWKVTSQVVSDFSDLGNSVQPTEPQFPRNLQSALHTVAIKGTEMCGTY